MASPPAGEERRLPARPRTCPRRRRAWPHRARNPSPLGGKPPSAPQPYLQSQRVCLRQPLYLLGNDLNAPSSSPLLPRPHTPLLYKTKPLSPPPLPPFPP